MRISIQSALTETFRPVATTLSLPRIVAFRGVPVDSWWLRPILDLVSFEALFLLFLFAPRYKTNAVLAPLFPVDPTMIFFGLSIGVGVLVILRERLYLPGLIVVGCFIVFAAWAFLSRVWSPSIIYASSKSMFLLSLNLWCLVAAGMIIAQDRVRVARMFRLTVLFALWLVFQVFMVWASQHYKGRVFINGGDDYLGYGRVCGMAALIVLSTWAHGRIMSPRSIFYGVLFAAICLPLMVGGGRGPMIATFLAMMTVLLLGFDLSGGKIKIRKIQLPVLATFVGGVGLISLLITSGVQTETLNRLQLLLDADPGHSAAERIDFYNFALASISQKPILGWGIGAWPVMLFGRDEPQYPHNLLLELMIELGTVGLLLYFASWIVPLRRLSVARLAKDPLLMASVMILVNTSFNAMTSGDVVDNRALQMALGLLLIRPLKDEESQT